MVSVLVRGGNELFSSVSKAPAMERGYSSAVKPITATLFPGDGSLLY